MKYDNSIILKSICDIFKNNVTLNVMGNSCESFKMIDFKFKKLKYSLKLLDMCNFIKGSLSELSKNLNDENKILTKQYFYGNFELLKYKTCFPYEFITKENIYNENFPLPFSPSPLPRPAHFLLLLILSDLHLPNAATSAPPQPLISPT